MDASLLASAYIALRRTRLITLALPEISTYNYLMNQDNHSSSKISPELARRLMNAVRAGQTADDVFDDAAVEFLGVSRSDGRCLDIVDRLGKCTAGRLAAESGLTTGAVTALVDRMEGAGYLTRTRDTGDRRKVWIEITDRTRRFNQLIWGHLRVMLSPLLERYTLEQIEAIVDYMEIGAYINRQRAALLQEHLLPAGATPEERMAQAEAFDVEAHRLARCVGDQIRRGESPRDFADPNAKDS
jgi:DNA-binding MarR family transcriptional regulator